VRIGVTAALIATVACAAVAMLAAPAGAAVVALSVTAAGAPAPLFEGSIGTEPHPVDGSDGSGAHSCSGSPSSTPAATATGALDDALRAAGIPWRGNWDPSFRDFFIDSIGPYASAPPDRYWSLTVNGRFSAGGCLRQVVDGDSVHFFYGPLYEAGSPGSLPDSPQGPRAGAGPTGKATAAGPRRQKLRNVIGAAVRFLRRQRGEAWARLALALRGDGDPAAAAAALVGKRRLASQAADGSFDGDVNATALAVLALDEIRPHAAARAAAWLAAVQTPSGGFGYRPGVAADIDTTGLISWALALQGRTAAVSRAADFVRSAQTEDGGFPALPGGEANAQSTGLATIALRVAAVGPRLSLAGSGRGPLDYLVALARRNGSIAYRPHSSPTPAWTTAQALLGLTARARLLDWQRSMGRRRDANGAAGSIR
jgi:Prenyltransferase and squalene oxidase repeat